MSTFVFMQDDDWADFDSSMAWRRILETNETGQSTRRRFWGRRTGLVNHGVEELGSVRMVEFPNVGYRFVKCGKGATI